MTPSIAPVTSPRPFVRPTATASAFTVVAKARGADPLPKIGSAQEYKNKVVGLVGQAQQLEREMELLKKAPETEGSKALAATYQERLDVTKLQLKILRDDYVIPAGWSRAKILFGQGFDKDAFWRDQIEAVPQKPVVIPQTPIKAAPPAKPQAQARPAALPAASQAPGTFSAVKV